MTDTAELGDELSSLARISSFTEFAVWLEANLPRLYQKPREKLVITSGSVRVLDVKRFANQNSYSSGRGWRLIIEYDVRSSGGRRVPIFEASVLERVGIDVIAGGGTKFVSVLCFISETVLPKIAVVERLRQ